MSMSKKIIIILLTAVVALASAACSASGLQTGSMQDGTAAVAGGGGGQAAGAAASGPGPAAESARETAPEPAKVTMVTKTVPAPSLANNLLEESMEHRINIFLPPGYETGKKAYPAVYFLAGYADDIGVWYSGSVEEILNRLYAGKRIRDMIFVAVDGRNSLDGGFYVNSPVSGNWEDYIVTDVVSYVDSNYRTLPKAGSRGVAGHSMGGFGSMNIAMRRPGTFCCVYSMSPGMIRDDDGLALALDGWRMEADFYAAYGAAFCPHPEMGPPYTRYPVSGEYNYVAYMDQGAGAILDREAWEQWKNGFGGIAEKAAAYRENLLKLKAITVDYGKQDQYMWIPEGCEYLSEQLDKEGVPHTLLPYEGDHASEVPLRLEENVLPFFSQLLEFE